MAAQDPSQQEGTKLLTVSWTEFAVVTVLIILRVYTRLRIIEKKGTWALVWALSAWIFGFCNSLFILLSVKHGMGTHISYLSPGKIANAMMWSWIADAMSRLSIASGKVAIVAFLHDVQKSTQSKWRRTFLHFIAISNICLNVFIVFMILFQCDPPQSLWNQSIPGSCPRRQTNNDAGFFVTAWGAFSDAALAVYPISIVWNLKMHWQTKVGLSVLMGVGIFAAICAAITCYQLHAVADTLDPTYILTPLTLWGATEMWVVIFVGSIPPLWPLMKTPMKRVKSHVASQYSGGSRKFPLNVFSSRSGRETGIRERSVLGMGPHDGFVELNALKIPAKTKYISRVQETSIPGFKPETSLELSDGPSIRAGSML